jgi:hypothetical protein|tara:strand:+ start:314 stop:631 length:318 start_codon:yes stop_codon:yes gene_type:complete
MEVRGKVKMKLDLETGTSKAGKEWQKQSIVIDTGGEFNNIIAVSAFGDKVQKMNMLEEGMTVSILCNVYSREYNGKYYHNIDGYHFTNQSNNTEFVTSEEEDMPF